ncbi:MAG: transporter substrate-binding domain-containing protein, partial [Deltaproteobacteria bacterium]|nr:transporter substrate-binding domain-containing protein [Deltaproteobacteria bacterium]
MLPFRIITFCQFTVFTIILVLTLPSVQAENLSKPTHRIVQAASELDYPPFALVRQDGSADGFSVDLLKAVTKAVGLKVNIIVGPWHEIKQKLADGHIDVLPLVSYSHEREKIFDFTAPYLRMHGTIFVRKAEKSIHREADLKDKEVLVMRGDTAHEYAVMKNLSNKLVLTVSFEEAMKLLSEGKHDAVIIQQLVGLQLIKKLGISNVIDVSSFQETSLKPVSKPLLGFEQKFCLAVQDGDVKLLSFLNEGLAIIITNRTYDELYNKWFGPILPKPPVPLTLILKYVLFVIGPILFLLAIVGAWYLEREVSRKTASLREENKERKKAEGALQDSENRFRALTVLAPVGIYLTDKNGRYQYVNERWLKMSGMSYEEAWGDGWV